MDGNLPTCDTGSFMSGGIDSDQRPSGRSHSITSSASASSCVGICSPSPLAVFRLITSSYLVGACTGRSAGFSPLRMRSTFYEPNRKLGPIVEAACWAHGRRKFFDLVRLSKAPIAMEAVKRIDVLFAIEREINGLMPQERLPVRRERSRPLIIELQTWLREQRARLSKNSHTTKAINYSLNRWDAFTRFLDDGRLCLSNNAAERELRAVALGRKNWTFAGSDEGGRRTAAIYTLIATAKLNDVDPQAWLADVLARLPDHPAKRIHELLPWNWHRQHVAAEAA